MVNARCKEIRVLCEALRQNFEIVRDIFQIENKLSDVITVIYYRLVCTGNCLIQLSDES